MAKIAEIAKERIAAELEDGEHVLGVGQFAAIVSFVKTLMISLLLTNERQEEYWLGVTEQRLIFVEFNSSNNKTFSVPLAEIQSRSWPLTVNLPGNPQTLKLFPNFGWKIITGFDEREFKSVLFKTNF